MATMMMMMSTASVSDRDGEFWLMLGSSKKRHRILVMSVMPSHHVLLCKVGGGQLFMSGWLAAVTIVFT